MAKIHYTITDDDGVVRVDKFLAQLHPEYSRAALAKLFVLNLIKLKGEPIQPGHKLRPGTTFEYDLGPLQAKPEVIPLPIIFEDDNVIVVNKPSGIISHARGKFWQEASVASFVRQKANKSHESRDMSQDKRTKSSTCISYIVGFEANLEEKLGSFCRIIESDEEHIALEFHAEKKSHFVAVITEFLKPGYWNEYICKDEIVFIFKDVSGTVNTFRLEEKNKKEVTKLCRQYAKKDFKSITSMLKSNRTYATSPILDSYLVTHASASHERGGIVHRLDRATSGVMICAKNEAALSFLQKQFSARQVQKTYIAVVAGKPKLETAIIDAPIARNLNDPKRFTVQEDGKPAQTEYRILKSNEAYSTLELKPKTGRTHQLRVHLLHLGLPIVGDELYGGEPCSRLLLHAKSLMITLPDNSQMTFEADLPQEFEDIYA
jgi:23S rRNA-/tRNA-specific pseudouridylate synthase